MTYTLRIYEPYASDFVLEFDTVDQAIDYAVKHKYYIDDLSLYETPIELDIYELAKGRRKGGKLGDF